MLGPPSAAPAPHRPAPPQKAESEELETQKPQVKLRRTVSEVVRPASTPPIIASAIKDDDDEDRIIAELEVSVAGGAAGARLAGWGRCPHAAPAPGVHRSSSRSDPRAAVQRWVSPSSSCPQQECGATGTGSMEQSHPARGAQALPQGSRDVGGLHGRGTSPAGSSRSLPDHQQLLSPCPGGALSLSAPNLPPPTLRV